jgi:hypothetical protein
MSDTSLRAGASFACPGCGRRFVVVRGEAVPDSPRCSCGRELEPAVLASGVYELRRPRRATRRRPSRALAPRATPTPAEPDLGFGESHGYGPAHGGPTGPGDAPGPLAPAEPEPTAAPAPPRDDEDAAA